jgi:hypothetical protein
MQSNSELADERAVYLASRFLTDDMMIVSVTELCFSSKFPFRVALIRRENEGKDRKTVD